MLKHHMFIFVWIPGATSLPGGSGLLPGSWSSKDAATGSRGDLRKWVHVIFFWGNKTSWRNPGRSDMCVCISCFKQFDLLFCWILKKVLLQLRWNCKMRSQAAAAEALRVAEECRRKEKEVGMGRMEDVIRCHHIYIRIIRMWCFGQPKFGINPIKTSTGGSQKNWRLQAKLTI